VFYAPSSTAPCLDFGYAAANQNCDLMRVNRCVFNGGSDGIRGAANSNQKGYHIEDCAFNGCVYGIHFQNGSARVLNCTFEQCGKSGVGCDVAWEFFVDYLELAGLNSESCKGEACVWVGSTAGSCQMHCCRFSAIAAGTCPIKAAFSNNGCALMIESSMFQGSKSSSFFAPGTRKASGVIMKSVWSNGIPLWNGSPVPVDPPNLRPGAQQFGLFETKEGSTGF
jgi:hypothetical protein